MSNRLSCVHHGGIFHFIFHIFNAFLILLFGFNKGNWSDSLTDVVYVLFFSNRDSLCQYFTAFLMGRWVNDECNFMDGQKWKMTINIQALSTAISPRHPICSLTPSLLLCGRLFTLTRLHTNTKTNRAMYQHPENCSHLMGPCVLPIGFLFSITWHICHFPLVISLFYVQTE